MPKKEAKTEKLEREYIIPLRRKWLKVPRYKRASKAIKAIKQFLVRHMKIRDRDLKKIKIDKYLNEEVWFRGIKKPPAKIKVRAIKEGEIVKVELVELPGKLKYKKAREERIEREGSEKKKKEPEKEKEEKAEEKKEEEEKKEVEKEKAKAVEETTTEIEKAAAKKMKHEVKIKASQPKHRFRQALKK